MPSASSIINTILSSPSVLYNTGPLGKLLDITLYSAEGCNASIHQYIDPISKKQNNVLLVTGISEEQILTVPALMPSQRSPRSVCIAFEAYNKTSNYAFNAQGITDIADFLL